MDLIEALSVIANEPLRIATLYEQYRAHAVFSQKERDMFWRDMAQRRKKVLAALRVCKQHQVLPLNLFERTPREWLDGEATQDFLLELPWWLEYKILHWGAPAKGQI